MAAPESKTINDLSGKWVMNKSLSDSPDDALALQGVSWLTRRAIGLSSVTLVIKQYEGPPKPPNTEDGTFTHIDVEQLTTGGLKGTSELRCLDWVEREHTDWIFGTVKGQSKWLGADQTEVDDAYLKAAWEEGEAERTGPSGAVHVYSHVVSQGNGWTASQFWGFQLVSGERRYCRNIVVAKDDQRVEFRLVYDYVPE